MAATALAAPDPAAHLSAAYAALGVPGLTHAARSGTVAVANALGTGELKTITSKTELSDPRFANRP